MALANLKERLDSLLKKIKNVEEEAKSTPYTKKVLAYIKWWEIGDILKAFSKTESKDSEIKETLRSTRDEYKEVIPQIVGYKRKLRTAGVKDSLTYFKKALFKSLDLAEQNLKVLPKTSYEIYEDALKFVDLFELSLNKSLIKTAKKAIKRKMLVLKSAFEVEGGRKNLEEEQKSLTRNLQDSLDGKKSKAPGSDELKVQKIETQNADISLTGLSLPEEDQDTQIIRPSEDGSVVSEEVISQTPKEIPQDPVVEKVETYPYWMWYPNQTIQQFVTLRYCKSCGRVLDSNQWCQSCGVSYQN